MGFTVKCLFIVNADSLLYITVVLGLHNCVDIVAFLLLPARFVVLRVPLSPDIYSHLSFDILEPNLIDFNYLHTTTFWKPLHAKVQIAHFDYVCIYTV